MINGKGHKSTKYAKAAIMQLGQRPKGQTI